jgi:Ser/Thr protein kinase RdoA (MazF antagonist)
LRYVLNMQMSTFGQYYKLTMFQNILIAFGIDTNDHHIVPYGSGLINCTWKVSGKEHAYILQEINKDVFKTPQDIATNLIQLQTYLQQIDPEYLFAAPLPATNGEYLVMADNKYYRLLPFVKNSHTLDYVSQSKQAYEAARQFGKFSRLLKGFGPQKLKYTLPDFHNLNLRVEQFKQALINAKSDKLDSAYNEIQEISSLENIVDIYVQLIKYHQIPLRVIHHDTKISNVLFDSDNDGLCVIDLDTVMPGYFISDVGDMMRTYLSEANEEERDMSKIEIREDIFAAIVEGYFSEMGSLLTKTEKSLFVYSGKFMIYMQALRFLTDFLNGDIYYHTEYVGQNLVRAKNQLTLLSKYSANEDKFQDIVLNYSKQLTS